MTALRGWITAWIVTGVVFVAALTIPSVSLPADELGLRRFSVDIDPATTVSQTFLMPANGLEAVEITAEATRPEVTGDVRLDLYDVTDGVNFMHGTDVRAADLVKAPVYRFTFPPIDDSEGQRYRIEVRASDPPPAGVSLRATKGNRYREGTMLINDRERWADLAFATFAPAGRSSWNRLTNVEGGKVTPLRAYVAIGALAAYWAALGLVLRFLSALA
jgi:hypothetical protein